MSTRVVIRKHLRGVSAQDAGLGGSGRELFETDVAGGDIVFGNGGEVGVTRVGDGVVVLVGVAVTSVWFVSHVEKNRYQDAFAVANGIKRIA